MHVGTWSGRLDMRGVGVRGCTDIVRRLRLLNLLFQSTQTLVNTIVGAEAGATAAPTIENRRTARIVIVRAVVGGRARIYWIVVRHVNGICHGGSPKAAITIMISTVAAIEEWAIPVGWKI